MKALTLTQPWATLVAIGAKRIETRSWPTTLYPRPLAIHAAKNLTPVGGESGLYDLMTSAPFADVLGAAGIDPYRDALPRGCVLAVAQVETCLAMAPFDLWHAANASYAERVTEQERAFGDYTRGRYAWFLSDVRPLAAPILARGAQGLWDWDPPHTLEQLLLPPV